MALIFLRAFFPDKDKTDHNTEFSFRQVLSFESIQVADERAPRMVPFSKAHLQMYGLNFLPAFFAGKDNTDQLCIANFHSDHLIWK